MEKSRPKIFEACSRACSAGECPRVLSGFGRDLVIDAKRLSFFPTLAFGCSASFANAVAFWCLASGRSARQWAGQ
jgi:hypothetical protein